ncbi:MAG: hypothetical protein ORN26_02400, partial [Candidatus Pacebacteria bacterium]|nr:hypothetical protein [Candidatus Paceibacterota bacterium]
IIIMKIKDNIYIDFSFNIIYTGKLVGEADLNESIFSIPGVSTLLPGICHKVAISSKERVIT